MYKEHLLLLEEQNLVRRSEIFAGTGSVKVALTKAIKSLSNVSGREAVVRIFHNSPDAGLTLASDNQWRAGQGDQSLLIHILRAGEHTYLLIARSL